MKSTKAIMGERDMGRKWVLVLVPLVLWMVGCATSTGVYPTGKDTYCVSIRGGSTFANTSVLQKQAYREANEFCDANNKEFQPVMTRPGWDGMAFFELTFMALPKGQATAPNLQPVPGVRVEVRQSP